MAFDDAAFLGFVAAAAILFHAVRRPLFRRGVLLGASGVLVASYGSGRDLWPVAVFVVASVLAILAAARWRRTAIPLLLLLVALFAVLKGYVPTPFVVGAVTVGVSYVLFRTLQVLADLHDGSLEPADVDPVEVLLFLSSFLTFSAGPIQRYESFRTQLATSDHVTLAQVDPRDVFGRTVLGYVKLLVIAPPLMAAHGSAIVAPLPLGVRTGVAAALFALWVYVNFSGYMDVVIGLGRLFGFDLPENFDRPDRSVSFLDLWTRWHITLSRTLLTYVFNPLVRFLLVRRLARRPVVAGVVGYLVVFFLIGWWHGPDGRFAFAGVLMAFAAVVNKLWQSAPRAWQAPTARWPASSVLSGGLGLGAFAVALVPTWPLFSSTGEVLDAFGSPAGVALTFLTAAAIGCLVRSVGMAVDRLLPAAARLNLGRLVSSAPIVGGVAALLLWLTLQRTLSVSMMVYYQRF